MASEAIEMEQLEIVPVTHESQSKLQKMVSDNAVTDFDKLMESDDVSIEQLMFKEKPSLMMEAFEKKHYKIMYSLSHCFCEMLKTAAQEDGQQREIEKIVCHLMRETKYEADRLRESKDDDDFDYVIEIFDKVHKDNKEAIEDALTKAVTASEGMDGCSTKNEWPLLIAAGCGFTDCVKKILEKEKDCDLIKKTDLYGHNFLMRAIKEKHRDVVKTVFQSVNDKAILDSMKVSMNWKKGILGATYETPLRWLIKTMPDMAKQFLELCVTEVKKGQETTYNYDFIDDFEWVKEGQNSEDDKEGSIYTKIKQMLMSKCQNSEASEDNDGSIYTKIKQMLMSKCQNPSNHVLNLMIKHDKLKLLKHPLVTRWIEEKWKRTKIIYVTSFALYSVLLAILTAYAVVSPITALDSSCSNLSLAQIQNQNNSNSSSMTIYTSCLMKQPYLFVGGILIIILSILHIAIELQQIFQRAFDYFLDWENYLQLFVFSGAIAFVSHFGYSCYCKTPSQWQLGALVIFCAWFNFIVLLKNSPTIGTPINLLFRICYKYIALIYLPILLVISFALPFRMLFVNGTSSIKGFNTSQWSLLTTFAATSGGLEYGDIFLNDPLPYLPASIVLFMIFVVIVSILFNNMLVGLAVGDASEVLQEANLINLACQVEYIILAEDAFPCLKTQLEEEKDNSEQQNPSCCSLFSITKIYQKIFSKDSNESQYDDDNDDDDDNNEIEKEDILSLEDNVMEELQVLREEIEGLDASMKEELRKILSILENIQQKVGP